MLPASHAGAGNNVGVPDVCNTPVGTGTAPLPYVNTAEHVQSTGQSVTVFVSMLGAVNTSTRVASSSGDEAGTAHSSIKGQCAYTTGNPTVFVESMPAVSVAMLTAHNNYNCPAGAVVSPGSPNVFYSDRAIASALGAPRGSAHEGSCAGPLDAEALGAIEEALAGPSVRETEVDEESTLTLRLRHVSVGLATEILAALDRHAPRALVLDLRGVPGGALEGALRAASVFLPLGACRATLIDAGGDRLPLRVGRHAPLGLPLWVEVDARTASAAEVLVDLLRVSGRAGVTGEPTYGKRSVQAVAPCGFEARYVTVGTVEIARVGEVP